MLKKLIIGLFVVSLTAIFWTEAHAGCRNIGGTTVCSAWITGSEVCKVETFYSHSDKLCKDKECTVTCTVDGFNGKVEGFAFCAKDSKKHHSFSKAGFYYHDDGNDYDNKCDETDKYGVIRCPATLKSELPLEESAKFKNGKAIVDLDPKKCRDCCPRGSHFLTFTAERFNGIADLCFDHKGHKKCVEISNEDCSIDEDKISLNKSRAYKCKDLHKKRFSHKW